MKYFTNNLRLKIFEALALLTLVGCIQSSDPTSEELIKLSPPTFGGSSNQFFTTASAKYVLFGECDPRSYGIEYSFDQTNWTAIPSGCQDGQFDISLVISTQKIIYARAKTKKGYTDSAKATIRLALPPTSPSFQIVTAGSALNSDSLGIPFTMSNTMTGKPTASTHFQLQSQITGMVYGGP